MKVIGVASQLAHGKDELANKLAERLNSEITYDYSVRHWQRIGFAHAVKQVYMDAFDVTWEFIEEWKRKDEIPPGFEMNVRKGLQFIGDGFRKIKSDIWIETAFRKERNVIISDCRYDNEVKTIKKYGGYNILMYRPGFLNNDPNPSESQIRPTLDWYISTKHEGPVPAILFEDAGTVPEAAFLYDYFLINNGTLEDLYKKIEVSLIPDIKRHYGTQM